MKLSLNQCFVELSVYGTTISPSTGQLNLSPSAKNGSSVTETVVESKVSVCTSSFSTVFTSSTLSSVFSTISVASLVSVTSSEVLYVSLVTTSSEVLYVSLVTTSSEVLSVSLVATSYCSKSASDCSILLLSSKLSASRLSVSK